MGRMPEPFADARRDVLCADRRAWRHPVALPHARPSGNAVSARSVVERPCRRPARSVQRRRTRSAGRSVDRRVSDPADDGAPSRLFQHRRPDWRLHIATSQGRGSPSLARGRRPFGNRRRRASEGELTAWIGRGAGEFRRDASPWSCFHDAALPRPGRNERADHRRHRSQVGHRGVQGERHPGRQDRLVDIRTSGGPPTEAEIVAVDGVLGPPASLWEGGQRTPADDHLARGGHASRSRRDLLLPVLHALQGEVGDAAVRRSPCLGLCDRAPAARMERSGRAHAEGRLAPASIDAIKDLLAGGKWPDGGAEPVIGGTPKLLRRVGVIDPESLESYRAAGGYTALRMAIAMGPEGVIREVTEAKLLGRGGAAFPAGRKWDSVARAPVHPHYLVCNADESEPGTFKDRVLME